MRLIKMTIIFSVIAVAISLISAILYIVGCDIAGAVGVAATIISVVLSLVSIVYSYLSGNETSKLMKKIEEQNHEFIEQIKDDILKYNYNEANLKDARKRD